MKKKIGLSPQLNSPPELDLLLSLKSRGAHLDEFMIFGAQVPAPLAASAGARDRVGWLAQLAPSAILFLPSSGLFAVRPFCRPAKQQPPGEVGQSWLREFLEPSRAEMLRRRRLDIETLSYRRRRQQQLV